MKFDASLARAAFAGICLLMLAGFPLLDLEFYTEVVSRVMIIAIFVVSLDLLVGYTGLISFGHAAWFGLGAYSFALLSTKYQVTSSLWITLPAAMLVAALAAFLVGLFVLRTRGLFFIMVTLAFAQIFYFIFHDVKALGGSTDGINLRGKPDASIAGFVPFSLGDTNTLYYFILLMLVLLMAGLALLLRSPFGRALQGIRENEHRMTSIGFPVYRYKLAAFTLAGALAGLAGYLFAVLSGGVNPELVSWHQSADALLMLILGGFGRFWGGIVGAFGFALIKEVMMGLSKHWQLWMGALIIVIVLFLPGGLMSVGGRIKALWQGKHA